MSKELLYDKDGNEYKVPHAVDRREWLSSGNFFEENPKDKKTKRATKETGSLLEDKE